MIPARYLRGLKSKVLGVQSVFGEKKAAAKNISSRSFILGPVYDWWVAVSMIGSNSGVPKGALSIFHCWLMLSTFKYCFIFHPQNTRILSAGQHLIFGQMFLHVSPGNSTKSPEMSTFLWFFPSIWRIWRLLGTGFLTLMVIVIFHTLDKQCQSISQI